MKKLLIVLAVVLMAASAFASSGNRLFVQPSATFDTGSPATTDNDDSCDIGTTPAATLLLPYFEVANSGDQSVDNTTLFSITNVSNEEQIAHVVVWTDWSYPVLDFNIWLTGYDVQSVNLYDILVRGNTIGIPQTGDDDDVNSPDGIFSADSNAYHDWSGNAAVDCDDLPGTIPASLLAEVQSALTGGPYFDDEQVGGEHDNMIGYITIDVVSVCSVRLPNSGLAYFQNEMLFDNVFIGEWTRVNPSVATGNFAGASPMVHIRAVPEGGDNISQAGDPGTNLPWSFYDRYVAAGGPGYDRRQPLPGVWAARYIEGGGDGGFDTNLIIWREGWTTGDDDDEAAANADIPVEEIVRFDEHENPFVLETEICRISPCPDLDPFVTTFPETSSNNINGGSFPDDPSSDDGGWMYMNLNAGLNPTDCEGATRCNRVESQNWVVVEMTAEGRYGIDFDGAWLGNGCSDDPGSQVVDGECDPCGIGPLSNANSINPADDGTI